MRDRSNDNRTDLQDEERRFDEGGAGARKGHEGNFGEGWEAGYTHGYKDGYDHASGGRPFDGNAAEARLRHARDAGTGTEAREPSRPPGDPS